MSWYFHVSDLKQWVYCPRVVFYTYCMPGLRPETFKMEAGREAHEEERGRERRRTGQLYGLPEAERLEDVRLVAEALGLTAAIDLVLRRGDRAWPVDYKQSRHLRTAEHFKVQLAAYGLVLEAAWGVRCEGGFLYGLDARKVERVPFTPALRRRVQEVLAAVRETIAAERMPPPTEERGRCVSCEFRRFCNDVF
jgi:CRISPR-associated exonuclease Cas4